MSIFKRLFGRGRSPMPAPQPEILQKESGWSFAILGPAGTTSEVFVNVTDETQAEAMAFKLVGEGKVTYRGPVPPSVLRDFKVQPGQAMRWS